MFLITSPVLAGELEDAMKAHPKTFLYLFSSKCGYCVKFDAQYAKLNKKYENCKFVKIDINSKYGTLLRRDFNAYYVPYVALIDSRNSTIQVVEPNCLIDNACLNKEMNKFLK